MTMQGLKHISTTVLISITLLISINANASVYDGCIACYPFNGDFIDVSPSGLTAKPSGDLTFVAGKKGQAVLLDGMDDNISLGILNYFIDHLTLSLWVKFFEFSDSFQPIVSKHDEKVQNGNVNFKTSFYLKVLHSQNNYRFYFTVSENGQEVNDTSSDVVDPNKWYHVVAMFQPGNIRLYIDGVKSDEKPTTFQQMYTSSTPTMIGTMLADGTPGTPFAHVMIDDFRLYDRTLSEAEILVLCKQQPGPKIRYHEPSGIIEETVSLVTVHFDQPIMPKLFTPDDIQLVDPNLQPVVINETKQLSETTYQFLFDEQLTNGPYRFEIGPNILGVAGDAMSDDDIYVGEFKANASPDNVIVIHFNDVKADYIYDALLTTDAAPIEINLSSPEKEALLVNRLSGSSTTYQQVWVFDASSVDGKYSQALAAISDWFLAKPKRQVICDGRMRLSYHQNQLQGIKQLISNYYNNFKINGGGLLLGTNHPDVYLDINSICEKININGFGSLTKYNALQTDTSCYLMSYPNNLINILGTNQSSMSPLGKQPNGMHLFCAAWEKDQPEHCNISTSMIPLIPVDLKADVDVNNIYFSWKPASPESEVAYYNVYINDGPFSSVNDMEPYATKINATQYTVTSLNYGKTYYLASTAVDHQGKEVKQVFPVSVTTGYTSSRSNSGSGGGCFINAIREYKMHRHHQTPRKSHD